MFRIAPSLGEAERALDWLDYHGFAYGGLVRLYSDDYRPHFATQRIYNVTGHWTIAQYRAKDPSLLATVTGFGMITSYTLTIGFDHSLAVAGVRAGTRSKLN